MRFIPCILSFSSNLVFSLLRRVAVAEHLVHLQSTRHCRRSGHLLAVPRWSLRTLCRRHPEAHLQSTRESLLRLRRRNRALVRRQSRHRCRLIAEIAESPHSEDPQVSGIPFFPFTAPSSPWSAVVVKLKSPTIFSMSLSCLLTLCATSAAPHPPSVVPPQLLSPCGIFVSLRVSSIWHIQTSPEPNILKPSPPYTQSMPVRPTCQIQFLYFLSAEIY